MADGGINIRERTKKKCSHCGYEKDCGQFTIRSNGHPASWCRACAAEKKRLDREVPEKKLRQYQANREWMERNRIAQRKHYGKRYATAKGRAEALHGSARARARLKGDKFFLTQNRVFLAIDAGFCEKTGIPFSLARDEKRQCNPVAPSIDKINPFLPYSDDNVQIVCSWYNKAKEQLTDAELLNFCRILVERNA